MVIFMLPPPASLPSGPAAAGRSYVVCQQNSLLPDLFPSAFLLLKTQCKTIFVNKNRLKKQHLPQIVSAAFLKISVSETKGGLLIEKVKIGKKSAFIIVAAVLLLPCFSAAAWARPVYAGGQSIGVLLDVAGLTVAGICPVTAADGTDISPAAEAGLQLGDLIVSVDGQSVRGSGEITELLATAGAEGRECRIEYLRQGLRCTAEVKPARDADGSWRLGLYVRDEAAGVGTLTFWDPQSGVFGALGHNVTGVEDGEGRVVRAVIEDLRAGLPGAPGEKLGVLQEDGWQGQISANEVCGIFGRLDSLPAAGGPLLETAGAEQVQEGPAELLTVLDGETVESFSVNIVRAGSGTALNSGLIVEVTDRRLLDAAGGIIQGMSGSPLIQNGLLIGAVSHVFVNDPSRGYGVYIEQMLDTADGLELTENAA